MAHEPQGQERRQFTRIRKHFILRFFLKDAPGIDLEISQIEDISKGGICFTSTMNFKKGDALIIELRTPYISAVLYSFEGGALFSKRGGQSSPAFQLSNRMRSPPESVKREP